jgi:ubiquitin C-terminal hydrolase
LYINGKIREPPGPINNHSLKEQLKKREVPRNTYAVNELLWKFLHKLYGGGPEITYTEKAESITNTMNELDKISDTHTNDTLTRSTGYDSVRSSILDVQKTFKCNADDFIKPIRLSNPSFYCYQNSCLQALLSINQLVDHITEGKYKTLASKETIKFWPAFAEVVHASVNREALFSAKKIKRLSVGRFTPSEQQDAHEFLTFLLSGMQDEINLSQPPKRIEFKNSATSWAFYKRYNLSMVDQLFAGQFNSKVTCKGCHNETSTFDPFLDLQLPIISEKTSKLDDCLEAFQLEEEIIDLYQCQKCKSTQKATKKLEIERYPKILNIQLKRFQTYPKKQKIIGTIEFPVQEWRIKS